MASGRSYPELKRFFSVYSDRIIYFALDGALAVAGGEILCSFEIAQEMLLCALSHVKKYMNSVIGAEFCAKDKNYIMTFGSSYLSNMVFESEKKRLGNEQLIRLDNFELPKEPIYKFVLIHKHGAPEINLPDMKKVYESSKVCEYVRYGISKKTSAEVICNAMNISSEGVLAYGDSENDRELLTFAGKAVTVYGAKHDLFSITKYHTQNVCNSVLGFLKDEDADKAKKENKYYGKVQYH